jgi:hypothetical protein
MDQNYPRDAAYTPRTIMNLELCNFKENQAYSKNKYFCNHKIVINSPEVYFGITRQHAEVGHKNIIIFGYKNHLGRFCRNGKQFLEKDLQHNFVQILVKELGIT